jgi:hypothetical protein
MKNSKIRIKNQNQSWVRIKNRKIKNQLREPFPIPQSFPLQNLYFLQHTCTVAPIGIRNFDKFWSGKLWGIGKGSLSWFYCKSFCIFVKSEEFCIFWHKEKNFSLIFSIFCKFLKTPYLTQRIWGKTGVPNKVNDTVAPWGLILQQFCVCKKCRSSLDLLRKKRKKI